MSRLEGKSLEPQAHCFLAFSCVPAATTVMLDRQRVPGWTGCTCGGGGVAAVWCWRGRRGLDSSVFTDLSPFLVERTGSGVGQAVGHAPV